ncbi:hypothetical protein GCM10027259_51320 [Micromonospora palomenae]|uniref:hypothetical protein n=1 Tax=Micromonospora palomenae TaxID=1461247 RepID=UPI0012B6DA17|nr:hypothetical protein [Micromonospora palomenae]
MTPVSPDDVAALWTTAATATDPVDREAAEAAARAAYRAADLPAPTRFIWCTSLHEAIDQLGRHIAQGHTPLVRQVRRDVLQQALSTARAPLWQKASDLEQSKAFGAFHHFFEWKGYYGEQRYDGMDERYDLMEHPYLCSPVLPAERAALRPVLTAVRSTYEQVLRPAWDALGTAVRSYPLRAVRYWQDHHTGVEQKDEARAVVQYCLPDAKDRFFDPAWHFYPDLVVLAAIDTYRTAFGTTPNPGWKGCREVALTSGPWWPFADLAVMTERVSVQHIDPHGLPIP